MSWRRMVLWSWKIKNGKAKVSSVSINADAVGGFNTGLRTYTFEVMEWDI
jgi:hypothetical protein